MPERIEVSLAGEVAVRVDGAPAVGSGSNRPLGPLAQVALACLVLQRNRPTPREELAESLWGEELPTTWRSALRGLLSRLRTALASADLGRSAAITNTAGSYLLVLPADPVVDVEAADEALAAARALLDEGGEAYGARTDALRAVRLTSEEFLQGAGTAWVQHQRARLHETHVESLEVLSQAALACGDHAGALRAAKTAVSLAPLRESAHLRVMDAHLSAGNRGEAIRAYHHCRRVLADELGVAASPGTQTAYRRMLSEDSAQTPEANTPTPSNLPASLDSFVPPRDSTVRLSKLLASTRLLTVSGPAGIGKSRLAREVCRQHVTEYPDGVWLVDLAELADETRLAHEICAALSLRPAREESPSTCLARHLANRRLLLLLDNCEHVLGSAANVTESLLEASPSVTVLATTREPLRVAGELIWSVPPLASPPESARTLEELWDYESVRLFADRASAVAPDLELEHNPGAVARICHRLDGVPLAVELAAAHTRALDLSEIASRLDDHLGFLAGPPSTALDRHHSLQATLEWSYGSLFPEEQRLFAQLAVFPGAFGLEAAERVAALENLRALEALVGKSLVLAQRQGGATRYRMLEPVRQFAAEKLTASGKEAAVRTRYVAWSRRLAHAADNELKGPAQQQWLDRLDAEHHNILGALAWGASVAEQRPDALDLALALWRFWELRGHLGDGRAWLETLATSPNASLSLRARGLNAAAVLAHHQSDYAAADRLYNESLAIRRRLDDRAGVAASLNGLGHLAVSQGDFAAAQRTFQENVSIASELADVRLRAASLMNLAVSVQHLATRSTTAAEWTRRTAHARSLHHQALEAYRALEDAHGMALSLENLGALDSWERHDDDAWAHLEQSLAIRRDLGDRIGICGCCRFLGELALRHGDHAAARRYLEESLTIARQLGSKQRETEALDWLARVPPSPHTSESGSGTARRKARPLPPHDLPHHERAEAPTPPATPLSIPR